MRCRKSWIKEERHAVAIIGLDPNLSYLSGVYDFRIDMDDDVDNDLDDISQFVDALLAA
ncbi:MAG: hypothetical protein O7F76_07785 [Planctomycetota bacterium]|nr:hypothetical protein [Planctomycetota bacterium]